MKQIGSGVYGKIYCQDKQAIKYIKHEENGILSLMEIDIMASVCHPNIMSLDHYEFDDTYIKLTMKLGTIDLYQYRIGNRQQQDQWIGEILSGI